MKKKEVASQKKWHSLLESIVNIIVGMVINIFAQQGVFPYFGIQISFTQSFEIACIFTGISLVRSFFLRRAFNAWHVKTVTK